MIDTVFVVKVDTLHVSTIGGNSSSLFKDYGWPIINILIGYVLATKTARRTEKRETEKEKLGASIKAFELMNQVDKYLFKTYCNLAFLGWDKSESERNRLNELILDFEMHLKNNSWLIDLDQDKIFKDILKLFDLVKINAGAIALINQNEPTTNRNITPHLDAIKINEEKIKTEISKLEGILRSGKN